MAILQRGLLWHEAERRATAKVRLFSTTLFAIHFLQNIHTTQAPAQNDNAAAAVSGFFGPVGQVTSPPPSDDEPMNTRKRSSEERPNQSRPASPPKRAKLSNGYENGIIKDVTPMELDHGSTSDANSQDGHVESSPRERERTETPPPPITEGPDREVQVGTNVINLADTALPLKLSDVPSAENPSPLQPTLMQCEWNPQNPDTLATLSFKSTTRFWDISKKHEGSPSFIQQPYYKAFDTAANTKETAVAWSPNGKALAIASDSLDSKSAKIELWDQTEQGWILQYNPAVVPPIICLHWNEDSKWNEERQQSPLLLAVSSPVNSASGRASITVYDPPKQEIVTFELPENYTPLEAQWMGDGTFLICGSSGSMVFHYRDKEIKKVWQTGAGNPAWFSPVFSYFWDCLAVGNDQGQVQVWHINAETGPDVPGKEFLVLGMDIGAHEDSITTIHWQPGFGDARSNPRFGKPFSGDTSRRPLLVTGGADGLIKLWLVDPHANHWANGPKFELIQTLEMDSVITAVSFSPDSNTMAAASETKVLVWNMDDLSQPKAGFVRGSENAWRSPSPAANGENGVLPKADITCLRWNASGEKLAYGVNGMVSTDMLLGDR